ncbi:acetoacetate--CoA ligase [Desulfomonile tiedjei]|uniref:Acetoacetyl-CoA synthase n=1 Tax=Desulfomonile tiedjei (strain ATCC 49306 / DSM 6799 / DCB-1) TaxID=706587 RepID=I4CEL1_DESTA|nr:acetoacetate--CoA ligase [Desulfomonile tiedjei]AFM28002.1 acetoacetyl-CoA synthase [Desulfomonile tiedjei DSM 6799]
MEPLWMPSEERIRNANITAFIQFVNKKYSLNLEGFQSLYQWSIDDRQDFWAAVWEFGQVLASQPYEKVLEESPTMIGAKWFVGSRLNFAENLLRFRDDRIALVFKGEDQETVRMSYAQLYDEVARMAKALREAGVVPGDRVAGYVPNMIQTVVAMLAATSMGAVWSSCSPDFDIKGVLDRFGQIAPKILFTADGYFYNGKSHDSLERISGILQQLPNIEKVVVIPYTRSREDIGAITNAVHYNDFIAKEQGLKIAFERLPFDHPLYIMYSSGTTGLPKCMVHGAGGTLIQYLKEHLLHVDLKREDKIYYFTTCGWMMWNWLVSGLAVGATLILFDGSPFYPDPGAIFQLAQDEKMTILGTSARYIASVEKVGLKPKEQYDLSSLRTICSTGSPLSEESFRFVYRDVKEDIDLASISGGTDLISCFALGCPILPVYEGELQCRGLGMKVEAYNFQGQSVVGQQGELVCSASFPSQPIYFWHDPEGTKYRAAYFGRFPNRWHHGDFIEITAHGGVKIFGRSDATLNPGGVRIGTAEIYRQVEAMEEISDSIVVGQDWDNDVRVLLFVKTAPNVEFNDALVNRIKKTIRENATPRHVPALILPVDDIPCTLNGKKVELAVRNIIEGKPVTNKDALANPNALDYFRNLSELKR